MNPSNPGKPGDDLENVSIYDIQYNNEIVSQEQIARASEEMDKKGVDRPIREEIDVDFKKHLSDEEEAGDVTEADATTDEEPEMPGMVRPKKGAGWWGRGAPLKPHKKGIIKEFVDGGGFPSPGRWTMSRRVLPDDDLAKKNSKT